MNSFGVNPVLGKHIRAVMCSHLIFSTSQFPSKYCLWLQRRLRALSATQCNPVVGTRLQAVNDEEEDADNEFWTQDFFAEGNEDNDYETESEDPDLVDSDFDKAVSDDDDDDEDGNEVKLKRMLKVRKPKDRPPGWKQAAQRRANLLRARRAKEKTSEGAGVGEDSAGAASVAEGMLHLSGWRKMMWGASDGLISVYLGHPLTDNFASYF
jgi:hypothetical protein